MPTPTDLSLNDRIALAKGWMHTEKPLKALWFGYLGRKSPKFAPLTYWRNPEGEPAISPDYVGTLEGMSEMLWELGEEWTLHPDPPNDWLLWRDEFVYGIAQTFYSPREKLGDCVADAWLYVFEEEAADVSIE